MPKSEEITDIASYVAERNAVLMSGNLNALLAFMRRSSPDFVPTNKHVLKIMLHKARTAVPALPMDMRRASKRWLLDRGYQSQDDGNVDA